MIIETPTVPAHPHTFEPNSKVVVPTTTKFWVRLAAVGSGLFMIVYPNTGATLFIGPFVSIWSVYELWGLVVRTLQSLGIWDRGEYETKWFKDGKEVK